MSKQKTRRDVGGRLLGGVPGNKGGKGALKLELRDKCREQIWKHGGISFVGRVMAGKVKETIPMSVAIGGGASEIRIVRVPPKIRDRLYAAELLMDRGYGKPDQHMTVEDETPRATGEQVMARILELLPQVLRFLPVDRKEIARLLAQRQRIEVLVQGKEVLP